MSALRQVKKVKGGYEVTVKCTGTPMQTRVFGSYQECEVFADDYFFDYLGVQLKCAHHPVGDGVEPEGVNPDSLETMEIEIPMNERLKELGIQAGGIWIEHATAFLSGTLNLELFADLVRQDERAKCASDYLQDCRDAVDSAYKAGKFFEREACALLCLELVQAKASGESYEDGTIDCAEAIRARGTK